MYITHLSKSPAEIAEAAKMKTAITEFRGYYDFLSNFFAYPFIYNGRRYFNAEAAYQAQKLPTDKGREQFMAISAPAAKKLGKTVELREDWEAIKVEVMRAVVSAKFEQNPDLAKLLIATGDKHLEEGNHWGDRFWGTVNGAGQNMLGKILMEVRSKLQQP